MELPEHLPEGAEIENVKDILDEKILTARGHMLSIYGIAWWDEIHLYQAIGCLKDCTIVFARDSNGIYDPKGIITDKEVVSSRISPLIVNVVVLFPLCLTALYD